MRDRLTLKDVTITFLITISVLIVMYILALNYELNVNENYIQNLEEKLNIYERSYEEFCLEDSIRQVE